MGQNIVYSRVKDYWAANLPVNRGRWNFDTIRYDYYLDDNVAFEAFKAGAFDLRMENDAKNWATRYTGKNFDKKYIIKDEQKNESAQIRAGWRLISNVRYSAIAGCGKQSPSPLTLNG